MPKPNTLLQWISDTAMIIFSGYNWGGKTRGVISEYMCDYIIKQPTRIRSSSEIYISDI